MRQAIKHTITKYHAFGSTINTTGKSSNDGVYAIMATVTGSYGEKIHRIVGGSYWDIENCIKRMHKYAEAGKYTNLELLHLQSGKRLTMAEIHNIARTIN